MSRAVMGGVALVCALTIYGCGTSPVDLAGLDSDAASNGPKTGVVSPDPVDDPVTVTEGLDPVPADDVSGEDPGSPPGANADSEPDDADDDPNLEGEDPDAIAHDEGVIPQGPKKGDRILIKFRPGTPASSRSALHRRNGLNVDRIIPQLHVHAVKIPPGKTAEEVMARYERHPLVEYVEHEQVFEQARTPNDPWYSHAVTPQWHLPMIQAPAAWDVSVGASDVIAAVLDSGANPNHEDLTGKFVTGWNFYDNSSNTSDVNGHGTRVSGTFGAVSNNGIGVASVAWGCKIMPIRVSSEYGFSDAITLADGLVWAADHGARVANMSFAMLHSPTLTSAAQYFQERAGVVTMSAGNSPFVDPSPDNPYILTISATDEDDVVTSWSTTGNTIDLSAPGTIIVTTSPDGGYTLASGTSHSAPIVAGVAALVLSANPDLTGAQVQQILKDSAADLGPRGWDPDYGWGRVNAAQAVALAGGSESPVDDTPPVVALVDPTTGEVLSGTATVLANAADDTAVARVDLYRDTTFVSSDTVPPHQWNLDTTALADGPHTLRALAFDTAGNSGISAWVSVTVDNGRCGSPQDCNDYDACTTDLCVEGACSNLPYGCDDGDASTVDSCDPATGCVHMPVDCDDNNACTVDSSDAVSGCVYTSVDCNDHNACTLDSCDASSGCRNAAIDCDDHNACTADACSTASGCVYDAVSCDDGDPYTADSCHPATGCVHAPIECDDGDACTVDTLDPATGCRSTPIDCDDHNACTLDSCDGVTGCVHEAVSCDDGDAYTSDSCSPATGCVHAPVDCDDGNACTVDSLDPTTGCKNTPVRCDDHNACTTDQCDPDRGCVHPAISCDDNDACTTDSCDTVTGCRHVPLNCPSGQLCVNGACEALICNGNGICEEGENCHNCSADCSAGQGAACGNGACEAGNGEDCITCPADCNGKQDSKPDKRFCCGAGGGENPVDCGDPRCNSTGSACIAEPVTNSCCGDGVCDGIESGCECAVDCGAPDGTESAGSTCRDGLDNDCDGSADCLDADCAGDAICIACNYNGVCESGEDCHACAGDCEGKSAGRSGNSFCCGNGLLEDAEGDGGVCDGNP